MACDRKCFMVTWRIENYHLCLKRYQYSSPTFFIDSMQDTSWELLINPSVIGHINVNVKKVGGSGSHNGLDLKTTFFVEDIASPLYEGCSQINPNTDCSTSCLVPHHKVYEKKRSVFILPKTFIIRCRMYKSKESSEAGQCFVRTRIRVERTAFIGFMEEFSYMVPSEKRTLSMRSFSTGKRELTLNLSLVSDLSCKDRVWIEIVPIQKDCIEFGICKLFLVDSEGIKTKCGRSEIPFDMKKPQEWKFPLYFTKGYLMRKKAQFLLNDTLTLKCVFAFSTGIEYERIEDSEFGNLAFVNKNQSKLPSALEDMSRLFKEGILCDMKLQTETETFNVHKNILSARSPVFETMFTTDMQEKTNDCVIIEDLEADTVRQMLTFLYSDNLEDLDWERAKRLYFAADKYNIIALKNRCSEFLKSNLLPCDCCELLLLSDRHQDKELKKAVQEYTAEYNEEILHTEEWMNLEKTNPALTTEFFRAMYLRNWRN